MNISENLWRQAILPTNATIGQVIRNLNQVAIKIVLVVNKTGVLEGTVSDGDIRRGLLKGLDLNSSIASIIHHNPLVVPPELGHNWLCRCAQRVETRPIASAW